MSPVAVGGWRDPEVWIGLALASCRRAIWIGVCNEIEVPSRY